MKVYVISSGDVYEGGQVNNVFVNKKKAHEYFQELVKDQRVHNKRMYELALKENCEYADDWLEEEHIVHENGDKKYKFHGSRFIDLKSWIT